MYSFGNYHLADYNPLPLKEHLIAKYDIKNRNPGFRVKVFHDDDDNDNPVDKTHCTYNNKYDTIYNVMSRLYEEGYTHVVNMKGSIKEICRIARLFNITIMDKRLQNYIASQL